jgi:hypothetical protein
MRGIAFRAALAACALFALLPGQAAAVSKGQLDTANRYSNVAILTFTDAQGNYLWRCTGTLVAPDVIITAAHCTEAPVASAYYSFSPQGPTANPPAGAGWTLAGTNTDGSQNVFVDPDWDGDLQLQSLDDIGVILLDQPVTGITPATIAPVGYLDTLDPARGTLFTVAGYGTYFERPASGPQKPAIVSDRLRRFTTSPLSNLTSDTIMLAESPDDKRGGGGTCFGDSGGPVFLNGYLVGVTSWGTSQFCRAGQAGYQRLDTEDAFEFYGPLLDGEA